jgi:hypothetical protein
MSLSNSLSAGQMLAKKLRDDQARADAKKLIQTGHPTKVPPMGVLARPSAPVSPSLKKASLHALVQPFHGLMTPKPPAPAKPAYTDRPIHGPPLRPGGVVPIDRPIHGMPLKPGVGRPAPPKDSIGDAMAQLDSQLIHVPGYLEKRPQIMQTLRALGARPAYKPGAIKGVFNGETVYATDADSQNPMGYNLKTATMAAAAHGFGQPLARYQADRRRPISEREPGDWGGTTEGLSQEERELARDAEHQQAQRLQGYVDTGEKWINKTGGDIGSALSHMDLINDARRQAGLPPMTDYARKAGEEITSLFNPISMGKFAVGAVVHPMDTLAGVTDSIHSIVGAYHLDGRPVTLKDRIHGIVGLVMLAHGGTKALEEAGYLPSAVEESVRASVARNGFHDVSPAEMNKMVLIGTLKNAKGLFATASEKQIALDYLQSLKPESVQGVIYRIRDHIPSSKPGSTRQGQYDFGTRTIELSTEAAKWHDSLHGPAATLIHEHAHDFQNFLTKREAKEIQRLYETDLRTASPERWRENRYSFKDAAEWWAENIKKKEYLRRQQDHQINSIQDPALRAHARDQIQVQRLKESAADAIPSDRAHEIYRRIVDGKRKRRGPGNPGELLGGS